MSNEIFARLFRFLPEKNAEELWLKEIQEYLAQGGDLEVVYPSNGWSLLHYASENLFIDVVNMLLKNGAKVDCRAKNGSTPFLVALDSSIDAAIQQEQPIINFHIVKILKEHGADENAYSNDGISKGSILNIYGEEAAKAYCDYFGA